MPTRSQVASPGTSKSGPDGKDHRARRVVRRDKPSGLIILVRLAPDPVEQTQREFKEKQQGEGKPEGINHPPVTLHNTPVKQTLDTEPGQRQQLVRMLLAQVEVEVVGTTEKVKVTLCWHGGHSSEHEVVRTVQSWEQLSFYQSMVSQLCSLWEEGAVDSQIAQRLHSLGYHGPRCKQPDVAMVGRLRRKIGLGRQSRSSNSPRTARNRRGR